MRFTDLFLVVPALAVLLIVAKNPEPSFFGLFDLPPATEVSGMIIDPRRARVDGDRAHRARRVPVAAGEGVRRGRARGGCVRTADHRAALLPNTIGPIIVFATLEVGLAILAEATLSFLGSGIQLPDVSLGQHDLRRRGHGRHRPRVPDLFPGSCCSSSCSA